MRSASASFICDFSPPTKLFVSQVSLHFNQIFAFFFFELLFFNFKRQKSFVTREEEETNKHLEMEICQVNSSTAKSSKVESSTAKSLTFKSLTVKPLTVKSSTADSSTVKSFTVRSLTVRSSTVNSSTLNSSMVKSSNFNRSQHRVKLTTALLIVYSNPHVYKAYLRRNLT